MKYSQKQSHICSEAATQIFFSEAVAHFSWYLSEAAARSLKSMIYYQK